MPRVVLLLPTATYRAPDFLAAAARLGVDVVIGCEEPQALANEMGSRALLVPFEDPEAAADAVVESARTHPVDAVVAVDEPGVVPAALASARLGLPHNPPAAAAATRDKVEMRRRFAAAGVPQPAFAVAGPSSDVAEAASALGYPVVVKPASLSASRGVIRADTPAATTAAAERVRAIAGDQRSPQNGAVLVESFAPGVEVAVEGLLRGGELEVLAIFDKPDQADGPHFAETLLVTPSRLSARAQSTIIEVVARAAAALGLIEGPIHAEARVEAADGPAPLVRMLEVAARSIGGLCSRTLRFGTGMTLEEVILRHAAGLPLAAVEREHAAAGVAMLYAPAAGTLTAIHGRDAAAAVAGVEEIDFTARPGAVVAPLPEDARYLGFVFARGPEPATVEAALRDAVSLIDIVVDAA